MIAEKIVLRRHLRKLSREDKDFRLALTDQEVFDGVYDGLNRQFTIASSDTPFLDKLKAWLEWLSENKEMIKDLIDFFKGLF